MKLVLATKEEKQNGWVFTKETLTAIQDKCHTLHDAEQNVLIEDIDVVLHALLQQELITVSNA